MRRAINYFVEFNIQLCGLSLKTRISSCSEAEIVPS